MKQLGISIIGTDTDVGKTFVTGLLGAMAVDDGFAVGMVKPVSSSAVPFPECVTMDDKIPEPNSVNIARTGVNAVPISAILCFISICAVFRSIIALLFF